MSFLIEFNFHSFCSDVSSMTQLKNWSKRWTNSEIFEDILNDLDTYKYILHDFFDLGDDPKKYLSDKGFDFFVNTLDDAWKKNKHQIYIVFLPYEGGVSKLMEICRFIGQVEYSLQYRTCYICDNLTDYSCPDCEHSQPLCENCKCTKHKVSGVHMYI